jgi:hypothetical protein
MPDIIGWVSMIFFFLSYLLLSTKKISNDNASYHWLNFLGALGFGINAFSGRVWAIVFAETVWAGIAIISIIIIYRKAKKDGL